ncbi:DUF2202 domain-containing protein [Pyrococcus kukulkanii]|uniref:DUF2202 domain-containing protein n=1 Tax=Pyrococcus kukulkanii TaxID=1609559 RepID=UPI0035628A19
MRKALVLLIGVLVLFSAGCISSSTPTHTQTQAEEIPVATDESGNINTQDLESYINSLPAGELTQEERDGLLYMVEEEKLAHDVYTKLDEKWGLEIFKNIANSESTHVNAVRLLF